MDRIDGSASGLSATVGQNRSVPERPDDELPSYLVDPGPRRPTVVAPRVTARDVATKVGQWVNEIVEGDGALAPPTSLDTHGEGAKDDVVVIHRVLGEPHTLLAAFDRRWGGQPSRTRDALGTLELQPDDDGASAWSRAVPGRLHLRISFLPVPVELEATPWHTYGLVLSLRPVRHGAATIGWHRRWAWFTAGHRVLDQMRRTLEAEARRAAA